MRDKHRAQCRRGGRPDPERAIVDVEAWSNEAAARLNRSPGHAAAVGHLAPQVLAPAERIDVLH